MKFKIKNNQTVRQTITFESIQKILSEHKDILVTNRKYSPQETFNYVDENCLCWIDDQREGESLEECTIRNAPDDIQKDLQLEDFIRDIFHLINSNFDEFYQNYNALNHLEIERHAVDGNFYIDGQLIPLPLSSDGYHISRPLVPFRESMIYQFTSLLDRKKAIDKLLKDYRQEVDRLIATLKMLLNHFGEDGITATVRVKTGENDDVVDYFIRMPDGRQFALMLRSNKDTFVRWRDDKKEFYVYKKGRKSASKWSSIDNAIEKLKSTIELKHRQSPLLGLSRTDRNRPIIKVLVLCNNTKLATSNDPELWCDFGKTQALRIYKDSLVYVVEQDRLVDFLLQPDN